VKLNRRAFLSVATAGGAGLLGLRCAFPWFLRARPLEQVENLSAEAQQLIARAFQDVDATKLWDVHTHVVGLGKGGTGCWVNPRMRSHFHPIERLRFEIYFSAAGVKHEETADDEYLQRLFALHRAANPKGKLLLLAFDKNVAPNGEENPKSTPFYTPNDYVLRLARTADDLQPCISVHPYRKDAIARLEKGLEMGAVAVKWLPNAMGIDLLSKQCDPFYRVLADHGIPLLTHTGLERAVRAHESQMLGNPLRIRRALDVGVKVMAAHCASLGDSSDLDDAEEPDELESFDLFLRLMGEKQYEENLFGEISAMTQVNRSKRPLREMLSATELHPRLVNGSDYPLPAVNPLISTRILAQRGYLPAQERRVLNEIFEANPLLFDFVLKRCVRWIEDGEESRFAPIVFETERMFT
jgi:mannonate dehydratase